MGVKQAYLGRGTPAWCKQVRLVGFSVGSMLAIAASSRIRFFPGRSKIRITCAVGIHGPDKIRDVMEYHQKFTGLDVFFSYMLYRTLLGTMSTRHLPRALGGGLCDEWLPWLWGWNWMRQYIEKCFERPWIEMEEELWSCSRDMGASDQKTVVASRLRDASDRSDAVGVVPVMRILSADDLIVPFETLDQRLLKNLDKVLVQQSCGHCAAFSGQPGLARIVQDWVQEKESDQALLLQKRERGAFEDKVSDSRLGSGQSDVPSLQQQLLPFESKHAEEKVAIADSPTTKSTKHTQFSTPLRRKPIVGSTDRESTPSGVPSPMLPNLRDSPLMPLDRVGKEGADGMTKKEKLIDEEHENGRNMPEEPEPWDAPTSELKHILQRRRMISDGGVALGGVIHTGTED